MYKTKIFYRTNSNFLEHDFNEWMNKHPNIPIIDFRYAVGTVLGGGLEYSIAVLYKE